MFGDLRTEEIENALVMLVSATTKKWKLVVGTTDKEEELPEEFETEEAALNAGEQWQLKLSLHDQEAAEESWFNAHPAAP